MRNDSSFFDFFQMGSLDGLWYWDLEKPENEWMSERFWTTLGYDPAEKEHCSSEWQNLIHPEDFKVANDNFVKHCENPDHPYDQVVRYRHNDGSTVWVRCRGIALRNSEGKPIRMLGAHIDVTGQKRAEEQLRIRTLELERANEDLKRALENVRTLRGMLPICSHCKRVRDDSGYWKQIESYIAEHSEADFSHGICPLCLEQYYPDIQNALVDKGVISDEASTRSEA